MIFKIEDLCAGEFAARTPQSGPPFFAVLGKPIAHSLSPLMQNAALAEIAKSDAAYAGSKYFAFEVAPEDLSAAIDALREKNFLGINLTIPHKEVAVPLLDDIDPPAKLAGACNTLLKTSGGWKGYNTDGFGLEKAVEHSLGREIKGSDIVIIGAGGAARAAAFHALSRGCRSLLILNRGAERLGKLSSDIRGAGFECEAHLLGEKFACPPSPVIINATSVGLKEGDPPCADFSAFPPSAAFFDMPYAAGRETPSVLAARARGMMACGGLAMLAWQGAKSLSIWTAKPLMGELMLKTLNGAEKWQPSNR